jgi:hypothetical protein
VLDFSLHRAALAVGGDEAVARLGDRVELRLAPQVVGDGAQLHLGVVIEGDDARRAS